MKPEVVEGARNLRAILTSDARPAILAGLNLSQEELMLRLCNDVMDADLEVKGLEERLRHTDPVMMEKLADSLAKANAEITHERALSAELSAKLANTVTFTKAVDMLDTEVAQRVSSGLKAAQAFTPLAAALAKSPWKERRKKPKKKAGR